MVLPEEGLLVGLSRALQTQRDWLTPNMIYEMCVGVTTGEMVDEAWAFVLGYLETHGVDGRDKRGRVALDADHKLVVGPDIPAPEIPEAVGKALVALAGSVRGGLQLINQTEPDQLGFRRREFADALKRAMGVA